MENERHRLVVGVDFGTTYSGVAYLHTSNPRYTDIEVIRTWPGAGGGGGDLDNRDLDKAPTEISYEKRGNLWGYQLGAGAKRYGYFKLLLDANAGATEFDDPNLNIVIDAGNPNAVFQLPHGKSALDVTADYLKLLYEHIISQLEKRVVVSLDSTPIQFVLTTPAIWGHEAQDATCEAAKRAGFTSRPEDTISMISEPEAAASYCLRDVYSRRQDSDSPLKVGERFVICDAGGGTVVGFALAQTSSWQKCLSKELENQDLVTYTVSQTAPRLLVKETTVGNGGKCGSTAIDRAFLRFLSSRIGRSFNEWPPRKTGRGSLLMKAFEVAKRSFGTSSSEGSWRIPLGFVEDNAENGIEDGELKFTSKHMAEIFDPVVDQILLLISRQVTDASNTSPGGDVSTIILVGGFGGSEYLYKKVKSWAQARPHPITVINPKESWSAVVRGAVIDGMESIVHSRKLTQHYGVRLCTPFVEGLHGEEDAITDSFDGQKLSTDHIVWFAKRGEEVETGRRISVPYTTSVRSWEKSRVRKLVIKGCKFENAPESAKDWRVTDECTVTYNLASLPESALQPFESKLSTGKLWGKKEMLRGSFSVDMTMGSADLKFECMYRGECYGETNISY